MKHSTKNKCLIKRAIAVTLGITLTLGSLMLPDNTVRNEFTTASAFSYEANDCKFYYTLSDRSGTDTIRITGASFPGDTLEIPSVIVHEGKEYPVTEIGGSFLKNNNAIKTVIVPDSVTFIYEDFLAYSSVEKVVLSNNLEHLGNSFCESCKNISSVECKSTNIKPTDMGTSMFYNCRENLRNEKGAVCLGNWLIDCNWRMELKEKYKDVTEIKIADLGNDGIKIDSMAPSALAYNEYLTTVDLEGIKNICSGNFINCDNLRTVLNSESVSGVKGTPFNNTPWLDEARSNNLVKLGSVLMYYKTDSTVIDLTSGNLKNITSVTPEALIDCKNVDTLFCNSDCIFGQHVFYMYHTQETTGGSIRDTMPLIPTYNIQKVYVDGKELTYSLMWEDHDIYEWFRLNAFNLNGSAFIIKMVETKTKEIFEQMDIPYYGLNNDKMGTHTPTEEFYIRLKIHNYLSQFDYDHEGEYGNEAVSMLIGGMLDCLTYATLAQYMLECAGVEAATNNGPTHYWNTTKIGDEWFESDDGWNAQNNNHSFGWFMQSSSMISQRDPKNHAFNGVFNSFHAVPHRDFMDLERHPASRTLGDINSDGDRDEKDAEALWYYLTTDREFYKEVFNKTAGDINFDGTIDVTDAVLLDQMVYSKAIDLDNVPKDGYAPTVKVAFVNGTDYENIKYLYTDREGYIKLPADLFEAPDGKKLSYDVGMVGQKVRITNPLTVVNVKWIDASTPDYSEPDSSESDSSSKSDKKEGILGDVNNDGKIDIEDAVAIIQHINGLTPLTADEESRADVSKDGNIDIDDAVVLISYINGNSTF